MSENEEFRDDVLTMIRRHDPSPSELKSLSKDLQKLASRWEDAEEVI